MSLIMEIFHEARIRIDLLQIFNQGDFLSRVDPLIILDQFANNSVEHLLALFLVGLWNELIFGFFVLSYDLFLGVVFLIYRHRVQNLLKNMQLTGLFSPSGPLIP
jgi:hypothetical protein